MQNGILFTSGEDRNLTAWDTASGKMAYCIEDAHTARVKGIVVLSKNSVDSGEEDPYLVASASSDGVIRVWDVRMAHKGKPNPLTETNTKSRLTCLAGSSIKCESLHFVYSFYSIMIYDVRFCVVPCSYIVCVSRLFVWCHAHIFCNYEDGFVYMTL